MLTHLSISHIALVDQLEVELRPGMTAITGETGAGKSIMLDSLALALGGRADSGMVAADQPRAEVAATFDLRNNSAVRLWLASQDLDAETNEECLLRRVITPDGRSRAWINGQPVTLQQLKALGGQLVDIHSQHEHQSLLSRETHRQLLDAWSGCGKQAREVKEIFQRWNELRDELEQRRTQSSGNHARRQLLQYQLEELNSLQLLPGELDVLEQEQKQLVHAEEILHADQQALDLCRGGHGDEAAVLDLLDRALQVLATSKVKPQVLLEAEKLLESARIQTEEACINIEHHQSAVEVNPDRLQEVEQRLTAIFQIARKHRVPAEELCRLQENLQQELQQLTGEMSLEELEQQCRAAFDRYQLLARELSDIRTQGATKLAKSVNQELKRLNMASSRFMVELQARTEPSASGNEQVEFMVSACTSQPFMPLRKVASGGELSRISLAIQVITAQTSSIPTLVLDEVDVGIGGETAIVVGDMLRKLGEQGQVICVTHQPTVAAKAHHHVVVTKSIAKGKIRTTLAELEHAERVHEVARMMGGAPNTESCAHAELLLKAS